MFKQNIKLFFRSIVQQKVHFLLTISGLVLGLTAVFLAFITINDEYGFDDFHEKGDRIFRVIKYVKEQNGDLTKNAETPGMMGPTLDAEFPEVELATHLAPWFEEVLVSFEDQNTFVENWMYADSNFFEVFDFNLLRGRNPKEILSTPGNVIVTEELAQTLFGGKDPIGKMISGQNDKNFTVAGVVESAPRNSHIQFDALVSWTSTESQSDFLNFSFMNNWLGQTVYTYIVLRNPQQIAEVNEKLPAFTAKYMSNRKDAYSFFLQPLKDVYLQSSDLLYLRGGKYGSATFLQTFSIIALLILLIACFNYINITTAKSLQRAKEVSVKKILGAKRNQLIQQFLTESFSVAFLAALVAFVLAHLLLPTVNSWFGKDIPQSSIATLPSIGFLLGVVAVVSLIAGCFPSLLMTKFKPVSVLRKSVQFIPGGEWPRQVLTTLQLTISIGLIAGTIIFYQQFSYLLTKDLGFNKEQVLVMNTPPGAQENITAFKNELNNLPGVSSVSVCNAVIGDGTFGSSVIPEGSNEELMVQMFRVDSNYITTFGIELVQGRFLNRTSDLDPGSVVINESFAKQMAWENPLERSIKFGGEEQSTPVVGVLKDFHFNSLHQEVSPLVMYLNERTSNTSIRLAPGQLSTLIPQLKSVWGKFETRYPFDYYFLDEYFAKQYLSEQRMLKVVSLFSILAIFIACLGLYGMASFAIARKRKEIGIRKVLGASVFGIVSLLSSRFLKLVGIALLIASPVVYHFLNNWLNDFAFHVDLNWLIFALSGFLVLVIVLLTVGSQSLKAALSNPMEALKTE